MAVSSKLASMSPDAKRKLKEKFLAKKSSGGSAGGSKSTSKSASGVASAGGKAKRAPKDDGDKKKKASASSSSKPKLYSSIQGAADKSGGGSKQRYNAKVERGPSAYKAEWSGFASGIKMSEQQGGGGGMKLRKDDDLAFAEGATFGYLFQSAAEKKVARQAKVSEDTRGREKKRKLAAAGGVLDERSKMQKAVETAKTTGMLMPSEEMNRKERRKLLRLTVTEEEEKAKNHKVQAHELMDTRQAWYQQGPSPLDQIAEKLVMRKAEKKGKQMELKYNYLKPHASWLIARARKRLDDLPHLGHRTTFADDDGDSDAEGDAMPDSAIKPVVRKTSMFDFLRKG